MLSTSTGALNHPCRIRVLASSHCVVVSSSDGCPGHVFTHSGRIWANYQMLTYGCSSVNVLVIGAGPTGNKSHFRLQVLFSYILHIGLGAAKRLNQIVSDDYEDCAAY